MERERSAKKILLVEGKDDLHVVRHLWKRHHSECPPFKIEIVGNVEKLIKSIGAELKASDRETLGILVDSNDDLTKRWAQIAHRLKEVPEIQIPTIPPENGFISSGIKPRVGAWLMPDNVSSGELENFIHKLIPEEDAIWPRAKQYIEDIPAKDRKFRDRKEFRAKIHAWLATRESPRKMGAAISTRDLNSEAQIAKDFYGWLRRLFTETA